MSCGLQWLRQFVLDVHIASHIYSEGPVPSLPSAASPFGLSNWPVVYRSRDHSVLLDRKSCTKTHLIGRHILRLFGRCSDCLIIQPMTAGETRPPSGGQLDRLVMGCDATNG